MTFFVVVFILLSQFMLKYFDEIVGKDLGFGVIAQLMFYFSIFMTPNAFPLAVLLSALMTYGNLGEHSEITAVKSAGISLVRTLFPIFIFSIILAISAYFSNNYIVPKANLEAFSLLYDVKQKKPSMDIKEGSFFNGIEGYSIKVNEKFPDGKTLKDIIIYDHTGQGGNEKVIIADSGQMYNILDNRYLILELFDGRRYQESPGGGSRRTVANPNEPEDFMRHTFSRSKMVFSLSSFNLVRTKKELFSSNRLMKNSSQLADDLDSMRAEYDRRIEEVQDNSFRFFSYHLSDVLDEYKERMRQREDEQYRQEMQDDMLQEMAEEEQSTASDLADSSVERSEQPADMAMNINGIRRGAPSSALLKSLKVDSLQQLTDTGIAQSRDSIESRSAMMNNPATAPDDQLGARAMDSAEELEEEERQYIPSGNIEDDLTAAEKDSADAAIQRRAAQVSDEALARIDSVFATSKYQKNALTRSLTQVRHVKNQLMLQTQQIERLLTETNKFALERYRKLSYAITIFVFFLIGAPLGSIIKKGGLGLPVLISITFFILFYVITMMTEKLTRQDIVSPFMAAWMANILLFPVGLFFLRQAKNDARLLETDFYQSFIKKFLIWLRIKPKR